jgi:hypothetical protein
LVPAGGRNAGLFPRDSASGQHQGKTSISGKGRPALRLAACRAVWAALPDNPVPAARFAYLTSGEHNRLARQQARVWVLRMSSRLCDLRIRVLVDQAAEPCALYDRVCDG